MQKLNDPKIKGSERKRKLAFCLIVQFQFVQTQSPFNFYALKHSLSLFENVVYNDSEVLFNNDIFIIHRIILHISML